jgi:hypothetical protein
VALIPLTVSVAVTVVVPAATPVAILLAKVALEVSDETQVKDNPLIATPLLSSAYAENVSELETYNIGEMGEIVTETTFMTVSVAV